MDQDQIKERLSKKSAGEKAAEYVKDGMVVGLGTGSTVEYTIKKIAARIREENLKITGIPTSIATEKLARDEKIPLSTLNDRFRVIRGFTSHTSKCLNGVKGNIANDSEAYTEIDLDIDGADEVDGNFNLIKGGGGAHTREKIIASASKEFIVVAGSSKKVSRLGNFPVPVEVLPLAVEFVKSELIKLGGSPKLRENFTTDNGNHILDTKFEIKDPEKLETELNSIPGVVDNGIFAHRKPEKVIFADGDKIEILERK
jgi:ribose 5-phosphate isomerase A